MTARLAVALYEDDLQSSLEAEAHDAADAAYLGEIREALALLRGKDLVCWCRLDEPCHADVLLKLANR